MNFKKRISCLERCERFRPPRSAESIGREADHLVLGAGMTFEAACRSVLATVSDADLERLIAEQTNQIEGHA
jgi:hypothetical protein